MGEKPGGPPADLHGLTAPEGGEPAQEDRKDKDQADADDEAWQRYADDRHELHRLGVPGLSSYCGDYAQRDAHPEGDERGDEHKFERRREALRDHRHHILLIAERNAEITLGRIADEGRKLRDE